MMRRCTVYFHARMPNMMYIQYFDKVSLESEKLSVSNIIDIYILIIHIPPGREDPRAGGHGGRLAFAAAASGASGGEVTLELQDVGNTSTGRKFALVEGLSHDLVCAGSIYHVHFVWQVWHGQYLPGLKFNKLKRSKKLFPGGN